MYLQMKKPIYLKMQSGICNTQLDTRISMNHWLAKVTFTSEKKEEKKKKKKWFGRYNFFSTKQVVVISMAQFKTSSNIAVSSQANAVL